MNEKRKVFYIDVGDTSTDEVLRLLEKIKKEISTRKIK